ncbi:MAG: InlB B-repeat-containing protein [Lachnospiraceae bacterium]|nr:InlB B-repeat-containing protein [Lachnospiraceae bacterium]
MNVLKKKLITFAVTIGMLAGSFMPAIPAAALETDLSGEDSFTFSDEADFEDETVYGEEGSEPLIETAEEIAEEISGEFDGEITEEDDLFTEDGELFAEDKSADAEGGAVESRVPDPDGAPVSIVIDDDHFPDYQFRRYLNDKWDKDGDGILSSTEISAVKKIEIKGTGASAYNVHTLKGIEYFTSLEELSATNCSIYGTVDLQKNTKLSILDLSQSSVKNILYKVILTGTSITSINVTNNGYLTDLVMSGKDKLRLEHLWANNTGLDGFPYDECNKLVTLCCKGQNLKSLKITSPNLRQLDCSGNNLKTLDTRKTKVLDVLSCNDNKLESLLINGENVKLSILDCHNNRITELTIPHPEKITKLDIRNNNMCFIKGDFYPGCEFIADTILFGGKNVPDTSNEYVIKVRPNDEKVKLPGDFKESRVLDQFRSGSSYKKTDFYLDPKTAEPYLAIRRNISGLPMSVDFRYAIVNPNDNDDAFAPCFHIRFEQDDYTIAPDTNAFCFANVSYPVPGTRVGDTGRLKNINPETGEEITDPNFSLSVPVWVEADNYEVLKPDDTFRFGHHYVLKFMLTPKEGYRFDAANLPLNARIRFYLDKNDTAPFFHADYRCLDSQGRLWIYASPHKSGFIHEDNFSPTGEYITEYFSYYAVDETLMKIPTLASAAVVLKAKGTIIVKNYAIKMRKDPEADPKLPDYWCRIPTSNNGTNADYHSFEEGEDGELTFTNLKTGEWHDIYISTGTTKNLAKEEEAAGRHYQMSIFLPDDYHVYYKYDTVFRELSSRNEDAAFVAGGIPERPDYPEWADALGYVFEGYYLDAAFKKPYEFDKSLSDRTTLYAKMSKPGSVTVTFDLNGKTGEPPAPQTVVKGQTIKKPVEDPVVYQYYFGGWYVSSTDFSEKNRFNFNSPVNEDLTLYARWLNGHDDINKVTYHWGVCVDGEFEKKDILYIVHGECAPRPEFSPDYTSTDGVKHIFRGWKKKADASNILYDFSDPVTYNLDLEAMYFAPISEKAFEINFVPNEEEGFVFNDISNRYEQRYRHTAVKPEIIVTESSIPLTAGVDYTIKYTNNKNVSKPGKPATVTVTGKGRFKGKASMPFYIMPVDIGAEENYDPDYFEDEDPDLGEGKWKIKIPEITVQKNSKIEPVIYYGNDYKLGKNDFTISNTDKVKSDTTITIFGKGNFTGMISGIPVKVLSKNEMKAKTLKVSLNAKKHEYGGPGAEQTLTVTTAGAPGELTVKNADGEILTQEYFSIHYFNNLKAGSATVVIQGKAPYTGTVRKTFKIAPAKNAEIEMEWKNSVELSPGQAKAIPVTYNDIWGEGVFYNVKVIASGADFNEEVLCEGRDFRISYSKNSTAGTGEYKMTFLGNYKGHKEVKGKFDIKPFKYNAETLGDLVYVPDVIYNAKKSNKSAPVVTVDGIGLSSKDYTVKYYDGDTEIRKKKITLTAEEQYKKITVKITGRRNLETETPVEGYYYIRKIPSGSGLINLSKAKIVGKGTKKAIKSQTYTGYMIRPEIDVLIKIGKKWEKVDPSCYTVTYANCVGKGNASLFVTGVEGKAAGSKTGKFKIVSASMAKLFNTLFGG